MFKLWSALLNHELRTRSMDIAFQRLRFCSFEARSLGGDKICCGNRIFMGFNHGFAPHEFGNSIVSTIDSYCIFIRWFSFSTSRIYVTSIECRFRVSAIDVFGAFFRWR